MINKQHLGLAVGPLAFIVIYFYPFEGLSAEGRAVLASTAWVAIWWITEAIPIAAASMLPMVLFPLTGALGMKATTTTYFSPLVVLFLGGFIIALAIEKWQLHQRIALYTIQWIGTNSRMVILGFMVATWFLSMWISNTATALMMLPIGMAIAKKIGALKAPNSTLDNHQNFEKALMLSIAYAASIGGVATLIGTPTNAIFAAVSMELYQQKASFAQWFAFGLPLSLLLLFMGWFYLTRVAFRLKEQSATEARSEIKKQVAALGSMSREERLVAIIFSLTALAWMLRSFVLTQLLPGINDTVIAIIGALILFIIPGKEKGSRLMDWETAKQLPWGVLLLFGGGLSIAAGFRQSELALWLGQQLNGIAVLPYFATLFLLVLIVNFFTEITSNVATASVLLPVLAALAQSVGVHPYGFMVAACTAASCAFMLPVATPPNAIAYSSGALTMQDMVQAGLWMNLISSVVIFLCIYFLMPIIWGVELLDFPQHFKNAF